MNNVKRDNKSNLISEEDFFKSFMGIDELEVPYARSSIHLLEFDVNTRNYKEVDSIKSLELIIHGAYSENNVKLEITFNPKLRKEIRKMKQFIKRVKSSKENQSMTNKPSVINVVLLPTRSEFANSQMFLSNPALIDIEEHGFLFNKNLTTHMLFPVSNVFMTISYNPENKQSAQVRIHSNSSNSGNKKSKISVKDALRSGKINDKNNNENIIDNVNNDGIDNDEEDEIVKEPMSQREAEEMAEDDVSYTKLTGSDNPQADIDKLIGLENVKEKIEQMKKRMIFEQMKKKAGKDSRSANRHMIFYGEPGTGKTTVARIMTGILYDMGIIRKNHCIEVNGEMLKGKFMGASAPKTQRMINRAMGGVLFIDEAYTIMDNFSSGGGYGKEVISVLLKAMEDHKDDLVIIFAGYEKEMEVFLNTNPGLNSRIGDKIEFTRYEPEALIDIFDLMLKDHGLNITREAHIELFNRLFDAYNNGMTSGQNGNARYVENLVEKMVDLHAFNTVEDGELNPDDPMLFVIQKNIVDEIFYDVPRTLNPDEYIDINDFHDPLELVF